MKKSKELLIQLFTKLQSSRKLAPGFLALIKSKYAYHEIMDMLVILMAQAVKNTKNKQEKSKLQKWMEIIKKMKKKEIKEKEVWEIDAELENALKNI